MSQPRGAEPALLLVLNRDNQDWDIKPQRAQRNAEKD